MATFNDTHSRPLKYVTGTGTTTDITSGVPVRIMGAITWETGLDNLITVFAATATSDNALRNRMAMSAETPTAIKSWAPQGMKGAGISVLCSAAGVPWTILYQET